MAACPQKSRKLWTDESMHAAVISVTEEGKGLRESARLYIMFLLRRCGEGRMVLLVLTANRALQQSCRKKRMINYVIIFLIVIADMGYGLTRETVMHLAYVIAEKFNKKHPFTGDSAGRSWFDGFRKRHLMQTICTPQPLSYCRAQSANPDVIRDFFGKLGAIFGPLNLLSKPMQIYNCDESGISIVHRPGRVITKLGRRTVYSLTSAEKGRTHTVVACVSATGFVLPPLTVYPRKRPVPDSFKEGAVPNTSFHTSQNGWINSKFF